MDNSLKCISLKLSKMSSESESRVEMKLLRKLRLRAFLIRANISICAWCKCQLLCASRPEKPLHLWQSDSFLYEESDDFSIHTDRNPANLVRGTRLWIQNAFMINYYHPESHSINIRGVNRSVLNQLHSPPCPNQFFFFPSMLNINVAAPLLKH